MDQRAIPFLFMRGGTSRGPYLLKHDLPGNRDQLSEVLIAIVGSGHPFNIDGIGGGTAVTTKVAILSLSEDSWADIDYFFAQVSVESRQVDYKPTCGNIMSGVGPAALELGLVPISDDVTDVRIRAVNTGAKVIARVQTPNGQVAYGGKTAIDGVPGSAAPIELTFMDVVGGISGAFLPTGNLVDEIDDIPVTCMDVAMPMVIARAEDFGLTGYESYEVLDKNRDFFERMEPIRIEAGRRMGMGDVRDSVIPKFGLLAAPRSGGTVSARYFMPWKCHPSMAVTGGQCLATSLLTPGSVGYDFGKGCSQSPTQVILEHASGKMEIIVEHSIDTEGFTLRSTGLIRTARKLASGNVFIPSDIWR